MKRSSIFPSTDNTFNGMLDRVNFFHTIVVGFIALVAVIVVGGLTFQVLGVGNDSRHEHALSQAGDYVRQNRWGTPVSLTCQREPNGRSTIPCSAVFDGGRVERFECVSWAWFHTDDGCVPYHFVQVETTAAGGGTGTPEP